MQRDDKETAIEVAQNHVPPSDFNTHLTDSGVNIQFEDLPPNFGDVLTELTELSYSFHVHGGWEIPPKVEVTHRDYYED